MGDVSELVQRASQGDRAAFGRLVECHWARLVRLARSVVGEVDAEDAVQDGLVRAWRGLPSLSNPAAFPAWISRVVLRVCLKRARTRRVALISLDLAPEPSVHPNPNPHIDIGRLMASLPPRQRAVMHLTVVEGMADSEIGPLLGITAGSVRAHRRRARQRLEKQFASGSAS